MDNNDVEYNGKNNNGKTYSREKYQKDKTIHFYQISTTALFLLSH